MASNDESRTAIIYLDRPSAQSCATCMHLTTASRSPAANQQGIPPEHIYCPILRLDLEPIRGRRATMLCCGAYRARFADWSPGLPDSPADGYGQFHAPGALD
ncbi:MAG TPA: hypothetical protein VJ754_01020 [Anaerolineae bacterium]|nr:hypothetical protein [Anaerolineae bacterium]